MNHRNAYTWDISTYTPTYYTWNWFLNLQAGFWPTEPFTWKGRKYITTRESTEEHQEEKEESEKGES